MMTALRGKRSALFLVAAFAALLSAGCGNKSSSASASATAEAPAKVTSDKEVCQAVERTYHVIAYSLDTAVGGRFPPESVEQAIKTASRLEQAAESWRAQRGTLDAKPAVFGDKFADAMTAHAKLLRAAKAPKPPPDDKPAPLPSNATPEERRKAALKDAAAFGMKGLLGDDAHPSVEVDRKAWEESFTKLNEIRGDYLDVCIYLLDEKDMKPAPSGSPDAPTGAPSATASGTPSAP